MAKASNGNSATRGWVGIIAGLLGILAMAALGAAGSAHMRIYSTAEALGGQISSNRETLGRVDERLENMEKILERIDTRLERQRRED